MSGPAASLGIQMVVGMPIFVKKVQPTSIWSIFDILLTWLPLTSTTRVRLFDLPVLEVEWGLSFEGKADDKDLHITYGIFYY